MKKSTSKRPRQRRTGAANTGGVASRPKPASKTPSTPPPPTKTAPTKTAPTKTTPKRKAKPKRPTSKRKALQKEWQGANIEKNGGAFLQATLDQLRAKTGDPDIVMIGTDELLLMGIPLPSFCLEYVLGVTVWPLERLVMVVGPFATCKSGFTAEVTRWFKDYCYGQGVVMENESKFNEPWFRSIIGWHHANAIGHVSCDSLDAWQQALQTILSSLKIQFDGTPKNPGPGPVYPIHLIVDSVMGKAMEESQARIEKKGHAGRDHPVEAMSITKFLRKIPQDMRRWPVMLTGINQLKKSTTEQGFTKKDKAGGHGLDFQESLEIELSRLGRQTLKDHQLLKIQFKLTKSSLGVDQRKIVVDIRYWDEPSDPDNPDECDWRQKTVFDWHGATISLLLSMVGPERKLWIGDRMDGTPQILDLREVSRGAKGKGVWSKTLGIPAEAPVSFSEAGAILTENKNVMRRLRQVYCVRHGTPFQPGVDYRIQRNAAKRKVVKKKK